MAPQATMFNSNVLNKATDQPHIPPFTSINNSPQIPMQVPVVPSQIPGFAMSQAPQNAMAQIAQLQSMIQQQQQQQLSGSIKVSQTTKQDLVNADDLTEKLKSTLHINDKKPSNNTSPINENVIKSSQASLTNHHNTPQDSQDWNDVTNDANSWSTQMATEESNRNERYKRGNANVNTYRPRNTYQNGNRGMQSNNGGDNNASSTVFFRNNDRYYQNGSKDNAYGKTPSGNGNLGTGSYNNNNKPPRTDMMNNRPPRMQSGGAPGGDYRPRPGHGQGNGNGRENRGGLKA